MIHVTVYGEECGRCRRRDVLLTRVTVRMWDGGLMSTQRCESCLCRHCAGRPAPGRTCTHCGATTTPVQDPTPIHGLDTWDI